MRRPFGIAWLTATLVAVGALFVCSDPPLRAQQPPNQAQPKNAEPQEAKPDVPDGLHADKQARDVYLNDSFEAVPVVKHSKGPGSSVLNLYGGELNVRERYTICHYR